jgi:hypothetical protein
MLAAPGPVCADGGPEAVAAPGPGSSKPTAPAAGALLGALTACADPLRAAAGHR